MKRKMTFGLLLLVFAAGCSNQLRDITNTIIKTENPVVSEEESSGLNVNAAIPVPTLVTATQGDYSDRIRITWRQVFYEDQQIWYYVYREGKDAEGNTVLTSLTGTQPIQNLYYDDMVGNNSIDVGVAYSYYVRAVNMNSAETEVSSLSAPASGFALAGVSNLTASFRESTEKITVSWKPVEGAAFYYLYRAESAYDDVTPNIEDFQRLDQAFTETVYDDYSELNGGSLKNGVNYYYYVVACFDRETVSERSSMIRGALLTAGAPQAGYIQSVSTGEILNAVRVVWTKDESAGAYRVYRITEDEFNSGNIVGTEIAIDDPSQTLSEISSTVDDKQVTALVWYDNSSQVQSGDKFYYRVAAVNEYGVGTLSSLDEYADQDRSKGAALVSADTLTPYAMLKADHTIALSWPVCLNADAYYVFAAKAVNGGAPTEDVAWGNPLTPAFNNNEAAVAGLETVLSKEDLNGLVDGEISDAELYFRILPVKQDMIASYDVASGPAVITLNEGYTDYPDEINKTLGENAAETYLPGRSTFGKSLYFKKAPPTLVSISATQGTEIGTVKVEAELNMNSEIGYLYDVQLVRTCWYGDETGVYPLSLPPANTDPSKHFPKKNQAKQSRVVNYEINDSFKNGKISWEDPMPDFDRNGNQVGKVTWDYAAWDREAWKCILRQKEVDMNQWMKIEYQLVYKEKGANEWINLGNKAVGWPNLSDKEFAHLSKWLTDCALNTIWQLNIPRMLWNNTVGWMPNLSFSHNGEKGGKMTFSVGSVLNLTGSGGSAGTTYSDWSGYGISLSMSMSVSTASQQPRQLTLSGIKITTPLYSGTLDLQMTVRDYGPFWGLWADADGSYTKGGHVKVKMGSRAMKTFSPDEIIMIGTGNKDVFNYQVHGYDFNRDLDPSQKNSYPAAGANSWHFTRINWPGCPVPCNNGYFSNKAAAINYNLSAW